MSAPTPQAQGRTGPKPTASGKAVCSTDNPAISAAAMAIMAKGGSAADAAIAAAFAQGVIGNGCFTNIAGSVTCVIHVAATGETLTLDSAGWLAPDLPPFRPVAAAPGSAYLPIAPAACLPGFVQGLWALHQKLGVLAWSDVVAPAIALAEDGHVLDQGTFLARAFMGVLAMGNAEARRVFMPDGFTPGVGDVVRNPDLAETLRGIAVDGLAHVEEGPWADAFVRAGNDLGWPVRKAHLAANPPQWQAPVRYRHRGFEVAQLAPPQVVGLFCGLALGVLEALETSGEDPDSAAAYHDLGHVLRYVDQEIRFINDPTVFPCDVERWLDPDYHRFVARILRGNRPSVDLSDHVRLRQAERPAEDAGAYKPRQPTGSCELSVVDAQGNWVQLMNTEQASGIPGLVVGGVSMMGTHAGFGDMTYPIAGWLTPGSRLRCIYGNTLVLKDGVPVLGMGSPNAVYLTTTQLLWRLLTAGQSPQDAVAAPRVMPLTDDSTLPVEARVNAETIAGLARMGVRATPLSPNALFTGTYQVCWRDPVTGDLNSLADPRGFGQALALP